MRRQLHKRSSGFTVIELLVVLAVIGLLLSVAAPRYMQHLDVAREVTLQQDLYQMRDAIDKFYADQGRYPNDLPELVSRRYLRALPIDPFTQRTDTWVASPPAAAAAGKGTIAGSMADIHSGAAGKALNGSTYATW